MIRSQYSSQLSGIILVTLAITISMYALDCIPNEAFSSALLNRAPQGDGKIHVTYNLSDSSIPQGAKQAIENAIAQWNSVSASTGVFIDVAPQGQSGDIEFKNSTNLDQTGLCAGYSHETQRVYYNPDWESRAGNSVSAGATVIAHEIGHFLGLAEGGENPSQATIMNNPTFIPGVTTCQNASVPTTSVQVNDATKSGGCIADVRATPTPTPTPECTIELCEAGCAWSCEPPGCYGSGCASPVVIDIAGNGFNLTDVQHGVMFDIEGDGIKEALSWTSPRSDDVFLVMDRNGNGLIDDGRELFGNYSPQSRPPVGETRNGFLALIEYDKAGNGGNNDGRLDQFDGIITFLRVWKDANQNGISEPSELRTLEQVGLKSIDLNYKESRKVDVFGNRFRYRTKVTDDGGAKTSRWAWDVFLVKGQ